MSNRGVCDLRNKYQVREVADDEDRQVGDHGDGLLEDDLGEAGGGGVIHCGEKVELD